jgi:hypothetical protein
MYLHVYKEAITQERPWSQLRLPDAAESSKWSFNASGEIPLFRKTSAASPMLGSNLLAVSARVFTSANKSSMSNDYAHVQHTQYNIEV